MSTPTAPETHTRILDATLDLISRVGVAAMSLEEVAAGAEVSRQTVYRHFGSRDGLLAAVIVREEEALLDLVREAADGVADLEEAVALGLHAALEGASAHPILQRLLRSEPEALLPFLLLGSGPVLSIVGPTVAELIAARTDVLDGTALEFIGDAIGRLSVSYVVNPREDAADTARRLARTVSALVAQETGPGGTR